jgi:hypothetical protein
MSDGEIKSALEIALERVNRLSRLSPDEVTKWREEEYQGRGKALAGRYLRGLPVRDLERELGAYKAEEQAAVRRGLLEAVLAEVSLETDPTRTSICENIIAIGAGSGVKGCMDRIIALQRLFMKEKENLLEISRQRLDKEVKAQLKAVGIGGSSLRANVLGPIEWREALAEMHTRYGQELDSIKNEAVALLGKPGSLDGVGYDRGRC